MSDNDNSELPNELNSMGFVERHKQNIETEAVGTTGLFVDADQVDSLANMIQAGSSSIDTPCLYLEGSDYRLCVECVDGRLEITKEAGDSV